VTTNAADCDHVTQLSHLPATTGGECWILGKAFGRRVRQPELVLICTVCRTPAWDGATCLQRANARAPTGCPQAGDRRGAIAEGHPSATKRMRLSSPRVGARHGNEKAILISPVIPARPNIFPTGEKRVPPFSASNLGAGSTPLGFQRGWRRLRAIWSSFFSNPAWLRSNFTHSSPVHRKTLYFQRDPRQKSGNNIRRLGVRPRPRPTLDAAREPLDLGKSGGLTLAWQTAP
jgi:hypothetical protein